MFSGRVNQGIALVSVFPEAALTQGFECREFVCEAIAGCMSKGEGTRDREEEEDHKAVLLSR